MQIQFSKAKYNLKMQPYVTATRFQCQIDRENVSVDDIISDTEDTDVITVYNDEDEIVGIYNGYSTRIAITIMEDVNLEFENTNVMAQIDALTQQVSTQNAAIEELGEATSAISETNDTQDLAIEDLAEAVSELTEE